MKIIKKTLLYIFTLAAAFSLPSLRWIPDISAENAAEISAKAFSAANDAVSAFSEDVSALLVSSKKSALPNGTKDLTVIPGGIPFGVKLYADGLIVVGFGNIEEAKGPASPALDAGMKIHDIITRVNGKSTSNAEDFVSFVESSGGKAMEIEFRRGESEMKCRITPTLSGADGKYRIGMWVRDSTAGIGTVTFVVPETLAFGGLGHGICDTSSGELVPLLRGSVSDVEINSVERGVSGDPGELHGIFVSGKRGSVIANTENGIFGVYSSLPDALAKKERIAVGKRSEIHDGDAVIYCTLGNTTEEYSVSISNIGSKDSSSKNFTVTVTDEKLLELTGGIVQGMSGSPIIQDGKLVGAVTHVLISDPTRGYGIFIENMLDAIK